MRMIEFSSAKRVSRPSAVNVKSVRMNGVEKSAAASPGRNSSTTRRMIRPIGQGARQVFKVYVTAFPDLHIDIQQMLAAGDSHVVVRWRSSGTHLGKLGDIPATGRKASNHGCTVMEVKNAKAGHFLRSSRRPIPSPSTSR